LLTGQLQQALVGQLVPVLPEEGRERGEWIAVVGWCCGSGGEKSSPHGTRPALVTRHPPQTLGDSSLTGRAPLAADDERCASVSSSRGGVPQKNRFGAIPRGGCCRGKG